MEVVALIFFACIFILILSGYPVAFILGGLSVIFGMVFLGPEFFSFLPMRIMGVMNNAVLIAVPLFIYMGIMLEKSGLAQDLLKTMATLFGRRPGGLAIAVIVVGALLAASTGIVGATVVTMGLISLPTMLQHRYDVSLATGTIAASGTLGQIIPPSVVLVLLGSVMQVSVGDLFKAALLPSLLIVGSYVLYVLVYAHLHPAKAPPVVSIEEVGWRKVLMSILMPVALMGAVLGSIFGGIASPTEAAAVGAVGATLLTAVQRKLTRAVLDDVMRGTMRLTVMVFFILLGATTFALVFRGLGGDRFLSELILGSDLSPMVFLILVMVVVFIAGFFIDFIEIIFIIIPVVVPVFLGMQMDMLWIGILFAINLQTSFLTPPFGFSLFYLKGVAPPEVSTAQIYKGSVPFLIMQIVILVLVLSVPGIVRVWL